MERLQKVIAQAGICSRRKAEELILDGKVKVNGEICDVLGTKVSKQDIIEVNGNMISKEEKLNDEICGRIEYLRIRFIYECGREPKVKAFVKQAEILEILKEINKSKQNYLLFSRYMEALIAFHKYYGGKEQ